MDEYSLAFSLSNFGPKSFQKVLKKFGSPKAGWYGTKKEFGETGIKNKTFDSFDNFRKTFDNVQYTGNLKKAGVEYVSFLDKRYPSNLKKIDSPPIGIFCKGNLDLLKEGFLMGVVGTRKVTEYGKKVTEDLVKELSVNGVCVVSGLALGVDALAHRTSIINQGKTVAVLGCGVDCCNPSENFSLYQDILKNDGLIISEYPLKMQPNKGTFPARNRIIAAISEGTLITEAAFDSGSLITADYALKFGKKVFAVPGPINSQMAQGSLKLLKQGATMVTEADDILKEFSISNSQFTNKSKIEKLKLSRDERKVCNLLESEDLTIDELSKKTEIKPTTLMVTISGLELRGIVKNSGGMVNLVI